MAHEGTCGWSVFSVFFRKGSKDLSSKQKKSMASSGFPLCSQLGDKESQIHKKSN